MSGSTMSRVISIIFAVLLMVSQVSFNPFKTNNLCIMNHSSFGAHYYVYDTKASYNYNELMAKIPIKDIIYNSAGNRNAFVGIGYSKGLVFVDMTIKFENDKLYAYCYGAGGEINDVIGKIKDGQVENIKYINIIGKMSRVADKDIVTVSYEIYDDDWKLTTKTYTLNVSTRFKYSESRKMYYVKPFHFVSLVPADGVNNHKDGSYFKNVLSYNSKRDITGSWEPLTGEIDRYCTNNITVGRLMGNGYSQGYLTNITNDK